MANIKLTYAATTLLSLTIVANSVSASNTSADLKYAAAPATNISFTTELIPTRSLTNQTVTIADSDIILTVGKVSGDTLTITDTPVLAVDIVKTDSVSVVDTPNKIVNSNIDFDLSDSDVDPDPVSVSDAPAMTVTPAGKTDSITVADSPVKQPNKIPTDTITMADALGPFTIGLNPTDSVNVTDLINEANTGNFKTSSVGVSDTPAMTVTPAGKTDSVTASDSPVKQPNKISTDSITISESFGPFTIGLNPTDTVSIAESLTTELILGETDHLYPNNISIFDSDVNVSSIRGYHRGLSEDAGTFKFTGYKYRVADLTGLVGGADSLVNNTVIFEPTQDLSEAIDERTGVIGTAGLIGQPIMNADKITIGAGLTNTGLLVNFIYTDTSDSPTTGSHAVNGHFLNETPMGAGSH